MSSLAAVWFDRALVSALAQTTIAPAPTGPYTLPPLPYPYEALEPQIDTITMQLHHDKHHKAYVDNANKLLVDHAEGGRQASGPFQDRVAALINDDSNEVGRVRIGVVHLIALNDDGVRPGEKAIAEIRFLTTDEIRRRRDNLESWSQIVLDERETL